MIDLSRSEQNGFELGIVEQRFVNNDVMERAVCKTATHKISIGDICFDKTDIGQVAVDQKFRAGIEYQRLSHKQQFENFFGFY